ncbi:Trna-intron endonuclease [Globisporangium polare]
MEVVTWAAQQEDPTAVAVHFDCDAEQEHERLWELFQLKAYGVALAPLPADADADGQSVAIKPMTRRTRVLSLPEAFYLLTTARCLTAPASLGSHSQIYERFSSASPAQHFQRHFVVQLHFRQLGWVLKSGLNYGSHYVLYRGAASEFHSEYIVYVKGSQKEQLSWGVVQALTRVAADVKKTVLLCDVACEELNDGGDTEESGDHRDPVTTSDESTLTEGRYAFYGQRFHLTAVAIRFWDVAGADSQTAEQQSHQSFAFQPQPVLFKKKPRQKMKRPRSEMR